MFAVGTNIRVEKFRALIYEHTVSLRMGEHHGFSRLYSRFALTYFCPLNTSLSHS